MPWALSSPPAPEGSRRSRCGRWSTTSPPFVIKVGVFVDSPFQEVRETLAFCGLHLAQLHGQEPPDFCQALFPHAIKSFRVRDAAFLERLPEYKAAAFLLEGHSDKGYGGTLASCFRCPHLCDLAIVLHPYPAPPLSSDEVKLYLGACPTI